MKERKEKSKKIKKELEGIVVSNKMQKSIVVKVTSKKRHPLYKKIVTSSKRYTAHTEKEINVGERVRIIQTKPISKNKKWLVIDKVERKK